jgi:hypothetical protein
LRFFCHKYVPLLSSTLIPSYPEIAFILLDWVGDDNQNQIFAAGLKNCVFYSGALQAKLGGLSG